MPFMVIYTHYLASILYRCGATVIIIGFRLLLRCKSLDTQKAKRMTSNLAMHYKQSKVDTTKPNLELVVLGAVDMLSSSLILTASLVFASITI